MVHKNAYMHVLYPLTNDKLEYSSQNHVPKHSILACHMHTLDLLLSADGQILTKRSVIAYSQPEDLDPHGRLYIAYAEAET
jgi:hypothetical protein